MKKGFVLILLVLLTSVTVFAKGKYSENDIGKIVLKSGKLVTLENYDRASFEAIAIVYKVSEDGTCFWGLGLNTILAPWAPKDSPGFVKIFPELENKYWNGQDGSDVLDIVKQQDPEGFNNLEKNYPALYFASTYGRRYDVGKYKDGWYIPTSYEVNTDSLYSLGRDIYSMNEKYLTIVTAFEALRHERFPLKFWASDQIRKIYIPGSRYAWTPHGFDVPRDSNNLCNTTSDYLDGWDNSDEFNVIVVRKFY